jgi:hypothetical protein
MPFTPDLPLAAPSYRELFAEGCFGQRAMIASGELRKGAVARGLFLPLFPRKDVLEPMDRAGGFKPIGFLQTNYSPETTWLNPDPELVLWTEELPFESWDARGWRFADDRPLNVSERYSMWQLLYLAEALEAFDPQVPLRALRGTEAETATVIEVRRAVAASRQEVLDEAWRPFIKLLVALQSRLWPYRQQSTTLLHEPGGSESVDPVERAARTFDPAALLARFELSLDGLGQLHLEVSEAARRLDPVPRWYRLSEAAPRKVTDEVRGAALRARDLYDAAYLLRGLYFLATESWLPRADEFASTRTVIEHRRRHLPQRDQPAPWQRIDLKDLLLREGLYPHRVHFFVEGDTEEVVLRRLLPFLGFELPGSGMAVTNMGGVDKAQHHQLLFRSATEVAGRAVLIADLEGSMEKTLKRLRGENLFTEAEDVLLWSRNGRGIDFEEANFSDAEVVSAVRSAARRRGHVIKLSVADVRRRRRAETKPLRPPPALTGLALRMANERGARLSKKQDLAPVLADRLVADIRRAGHLAKAGERRPLLAGLWRWIVQAR